MATSLETIDKTGEGFGSPIALPDSRYPTGWFQIAWSDEIAPGEVKLVHYFGQDIVLWRGESGQLNALDAYCQHLGANLGVKGEVCGEEIECPWHGWRWNGEGRNTLIPYSKKQPRKDRVRIKVWELREWYGMVIVWHDKAGREPLWEVPKIEQLERPGYLPIRPDMRDQFKIKAHPQLIVENGVDFAHIVKVHGMGVWPEIKNVEFEDHIFHATVDAEYGAKKKTTWMTPEGGFKLTMEFLVFGIGMGYTYWPPELIDATMIVNITPVDEVYSVQWYSMTGAVPDAVDGEPNDALKAMIKHQHKTVLQDHFTWENMKVLHPANFAPEEYDNYAAVRRWARQFYPHLYPEQAGVQA